MMKGKDSSDSGKFKSFDDLINVSRESGAIRSFGEYLSKMPYSGPGHSGPVHEEAKPVEELVEEVNEDKVFTEEPETKKEPEVKKPKDQVVEEKVHEDSNAYRIIKDRNENFECTIQVEGTTLSESKARIIVESGSWNFTFYGTIGPDGRCVVPIKKGIPLNEGATGKIKLEVIADDQLFVGWESDFVVETSKKVSVSLKESKSVKVSF